jgi:hypothetical protein
MRLNSVGGLGVGGPAQSNQYPIGAFIGGWYFFKNKSPNTPRILKYKAHNDSNLYLFNKYFGASDTIYYTADLPRPSLLMDGLGRP